MSRTDDTDYPNEVPLRVARPDRGGKRDGTGLDGRTGPALRRGRVGIRHGYDR